jgi:acyl carrier protein
MTFPSIQSLVQRVLARHVRPDITPVQAWHSLKDDLHLTPLELVVVALEIEEAGQVDVSVEELATADTVGDLVRWFSKAASFPPDGLVHA